MNDLAEYEAIKARHVGAPVVADRMATSPIAWQPIVIDVGEDVDPIKPRAWLLGNTFCREFVSSVLAAGATGKTALRIAQLLALSSGRPLTGEHVFVRCRVMLIGLEDGIDELRRRVRAAIRYYSIPAEELCGWFYIVSLPPEGGLFVAQGEEGPLQQWLLHEIIDKHLDLVCLDPLVKLHDAEENDNGAIEKVIGALARTAIAHAVAIDVPHHISKGVADPGNADRGRGAGSFKDGGRLVYTLCAMSEDEAKRYGINEEDRRRYIRLDPGKVNLAPSAQTRWFQLVSVRLDNGTDLYPHGDEIQVAVPWQPPATWSELPTDALNAALTEIDAGLSDGRKYSDAPRAKDTAAWPVLQKHIPHKTEPQCREIIRTWVTKGVLYSEEYINPISREKQNGLRLDPTRRPT
jgi:hypothetical protein